MKSIAVGIPLAWALMLIGGRARIAAAIVLLCVLALYYVEQIRK